MKEGKTFSSHEEWSEYSLKCASTMEEDLMAYIFSFNESERQREYEITMNELWEKALDYTSSICGGGFVSCLLSLHSDMKKRGFVCSLDEKINGLNESLGDISALLHDPLMRSLYFGPEEEKTPGETIPQETPGETIPKKKPGRPPQTVREVIIYKDKEIAFEVLKECLGRKNGVDLAYLVEAAILLGLIKKPPSFSAMKEELGVIGWPNGFDKPFKKIHDPIQGQVDSISLESAMNILKETLDRKQNNHGNN